MHEPLTTQLVAELLQKLLAAFPRNLGSQNPSMMADVYRNGLRGLDGDAVRAATDIAIQTDTYFPKVARIRELAGEWTRRNRPTVEQQVDADPTWCNHCQTRVTTQQRWRPKVDDNWHPICTRDGLYLLLESYSRDLCDCAVKSPYMALEGISPPAMRADKAPQSALLRAVLRADAVVGAEAA